MQCDKSACFQPIARGQLEKIAKQLENQMNRTGHATNTTTNLREIVQQCPVSLW